jgi:hypothetical protein
MESAALVGAVPRRDLNGWPPFGTFASSRKPSRQRDIPAFSLRYIGFAAILGMRHKLPVVCIWLQGRTGAPVSSMVRAVLQGCFHIALSALLRVFVWVGLCGAAGNYGFEAKSS